MECLTEKIKIQEIFKQVIELNQKKDKALKEEAINHFLDKIVALQNHINEKTESLHYINSKFQEISWFNNLDEESLDLVKQILETSSKLHDKLIRYYVKLGWVIRKNIATQAMHGFKMELDDLKERSQDLNDLFFNLPADTNFTKRIETLSK